jgi:hypothetical protein
MKKAWICIVAIFMVASLLAIFITPALAATSSPNKIDYVALGDSVASGVVHVRQASRWNWVQIMAIRMTLQTCSKKRYLG